MNEKKELNRAILIDPYSEGHYHEIINASYLYLISQLYKEVVYVTPKSAFDNAIRTLHEYGLEVHNVKLEAIKYHGFDHTHFNGEKYMIYHTINCYTDIRRYMKTEPGEDVFYNNNLIFGLNSLNRAVKKKGNRVFIMCHMELDNMAKTNDIISRPERFTRYFLRKFFKSEISPLIKLIVLGDNIRENVLRFSRPGNAERLFSMDHSYFRPTIDVHQEVTLPSNRGLKIGIPSLINKHRGLEHLFTLLKAIKDDRNFDIFAIGRVETEQSMENTKLIMLNKSKELLSSEKYSAYTKAMDAMVFFVTNNDYGASGGIIESIWSEKMILTLQNGYAEYIFKKYGPMGYIFKDINDMTDFLNNHIDELFSRREEFMTNLKKAKEALKPENMVHILADIINK